MSAKRKSRSIQDEFEALPASSADYMLLAAALAVPLYTTSLTILQPLAGLFYVLLCWGGILFSYLVRTSGLPPALAHGTGYIHLVVAFLVFSNLDWLNGSMPGDGFPWQMAPAAFMCWFLIVAAYFLWTDSSMMFLLVPGIALFGVQSYIETSANFAISMSLFMISVAVLLTRLHMRTMKGMAAWAGFRDFALLHRGPWKAVAGPTLAVVSVLVISLASYLIAPGLGGAMRKLAGEPELRFAPPGANRQTGPSSDVSKRIGQGPLSASDHEVLELTGDLGVTYLRSEIYGTYGGTGFRARRMAQGDVVPLQSTGTSSRIPEGFVYEPEPSESLVQERRLGVTLRSLARRHAASYVPPGAVRRFEYMGGVTAYFDQVVYFGDMFPTGKEYYVETAHSSPTPQQLRSAPPTDRRYQLSRNTGPYADQTPDAVRDLARQAAQRADNDYDAVREIIHEIQQRTRYNLQAEAITGQVDRIETFLFDTNEGYCDLFAGSLTVMCRAVGLRARLVGGFLAPPEEAEDGSIIVRDRHAHLWTEVYFDGYGWIPFDATEGAREVPGGEVGSLLDNGDGDTSAGLAFAATIGGTIFGISFLALLFGTFWPRLKAMWSRKGVERRVAPYYNDYLRALHRVVARPKQLSETTLEYASAYADKNEPHGGEARDVAVMLDRALFSAASLSNEEWANLKERIAALGRDAKRYARQPRV